MLQGPQARTLVRALEILGSVGQLPAALNVSVEELRTYFSGERPLPQPLFLAALDIVASGALAGLSPDRPAYGRAASP
jgi:hypothetical protein